MEPFEDLCIAILSPFCIYFETLGPHHSK